MSCLLPELVIPFILYAETHYKFKGIYSRLFKNEPEIIADAPFRVEPGQPIPVLILVKDAHRFPIEIRDILIEIKQADKLISKNCIPLNRSIHNDVFWHQIFYLDRPQDLVGSVAIDVEVIIKTNGKIKKYHNDNYRISSHQPLKVYLAKDQMPRFDNWRFGDFHYHSNYTEDQVEFGAPLEATVEIARAIGLSFFAVTDHSYDLDDQENSWTENDNRIPKWHYFWNEVEKINSQKSDFVILPGEEVSAGNCNNRNIHLLVINNKNFIYGKGDSAERWLQTKPDFSIKQVLDQMNKNTLAIAGHPEMPTPFLQWLLIRRDHWRWQDFQHKRLNGFQIWNGEFNHSNILGSTNWVRLLLEGKRLSLIAGNDAHGNFNRLRQIRFPFFAFKENYKQLFGNMRTGVRVPGNWNKQNIINAVKSNRVLVTNGPVVNLSLKNESGQIALIGDEIIGNHLVFAVDVKSTEEFGKLDLIKLLRGNLRTKNETVEFVMENFADPYNLHWEQKLIDLSKRTYLRAELTTRRPDGKVARCLTDPIWIKK